MVEGDLDREWTSLLIEIDLKQENGQWKVNYLGNRVRAKLTLLNWKPCVMVELGNNKYAYVCIPNLRHEWVTREGLWDKRSWGE